MNEGTTQINKILAGALACDRESMLDESSINLLSLARLIVDIHYKARYGKGLGNLTDKMYTVGKQINYQQEDV